MFGVTTDTCDIKDITNYCYWTTFAFWFFLLFLYCYSMLYNNNNNNNNNNRPLLQRQLYQNLLFSCRWIGRSNDMFTNNRCHHGNFTNPGCRETYFNENARNIFTSVSYLKIHILKALCLRVCVSTSTLASHVPAWPPTCLAACLRRYIATGGERRRASARLCLVKLTGHRLMKQKLELNL